MTPPPSRSPTSALAVVPTPTGDLPLGSTTPRLYSKPLVTGPPGPCGCGCALTDQTSYGYDVVAFADRVLGEPLDPWQRWLAIHGGELLPDGRPRWRRVLVLVARQNGKTTLLRTLALYWLFVERVKLIFGVSTNLDYAREAWESCVQRAEAHRLFNPLIPRRGGIRRVNGEQTLTTTEGCRYRIGASNRKGGRSLSIDRLIADELREQTTWVSYNAAYNALQARRHGQAWFITNQGDDSSVVLNSLRRDALKSADPRLGIFEWSGPDGCDLDDPQALAAANPNLGRRIAWEDLLGPARAAMAAEAAGEPEAAIGFRTEVLCQRVVLLDPAIDPASWARCLDPGSLADLRTRLAVVIDAAPDGGHVTAYAAAVLDDGRVRVDPVQAWSGRGCIDTAERALPDLLAQVRPRTLGWFPTGPGAALAAKLRDRKQRGWPPPGVKIEEIRAETAAVCMGFAGLVAAGQIAHSGDALLDAHVALAERHHRPGDTWTFSRKGQVGHVDAVYAAAGAAHLARTLPPPPDPIVITARR